MIVTAVESTTLRIIAYDENLARRVRALTVGRKDVVEQMMFGGIAFMCRGRMACGLVRDELMVRVGPERYDETLRRPHVRPMDFTKRPMRGLVFVSLAGVEDDADLQAWLQLAFEVAESSPPKKRPAKQRPPSTPSAKGQSAKQRPAKQRGRG